MFTTENELTDGQPIAEGGAAPTEGLEQRQQGAQGQEGQPEQEPEPDFDPKTSYAELQKTIQNMQREFGQTRAMQSKLDKIAQSLETQRAPQNNQNQDFLSKYTPEQIIESEALIEHLWKKKFGKDWEGLQSFQKEASVDRAASTVEKTARNLLGEDYEKLTPSMNAVGKELWEASQQGNQRAQRLLDLLKTDPEIGGEMFTALAQKHYAENVQERSTQAVNAQVKRGERAAAGVAGGAQRGKVTKDPSKMSIDELRAAAEAEALQG